MQLDPKKSLLLAFKHLDQFSIPALGTFRRSRMAAKIDHQSKKILPPMEVFVLDSGEAEPTALEDFFFRFYNLKINQAKELMAKVSDFVSEELKTNGLIYFEGIGKLKGSSEDNVAFEAEEGVFGQTSDFFGLQAIDYNIGAAEKPNLEKKSSVARESALANQVVVEPAPPPVKRRKFPVGLFLFLLVILGLSGAAFVWQDQLTEAINGFAFGKGKEIGPEITTTEHKSEGPENGLALVDSAGKVGETLGVNGSDSAANQEALKGSDGDLAEKEALAAKLEKEIAAETEKVKAKQLADAKAKEIADANAKKIADAKAKQLADAEVKRIADAKAKQLAEAKAKQLAAEKTKAEATKNNVTDNGNYGQSAQSGRYYLVISTTPNGADAEAAAKAITASGATPKALKSYGRYKVSAFDSPDKAKVIAKMVEWKNKYSKSWIYWVGM